MNAMYLVVSFILTLLFVRNYHGLKSMVTARVMIVLFILTFILSVLFPNMISKLGDFFGFGRGADFMFYTFVIFSIGVFGLLHKKIYLLERRLLVLNRQVSINLKSSRNECD